MGPLTDLIPVHPFSTPWKPPGIKSFFLYSNNVDAFNFFLHNFFLLISFLNTVLIIHFIFNWLKKIRFLATFSSEKQILIYLLFLWYVYKTHLLISVSICLIILFYCTKLLYDRQKISQSFFTEPGYYNNTNISIAN